MSDVLPEPALILSPPDVVAWRRTFPARSDVVAVVTGSYDLLQPGNLLALRRAAAGDRAVCVVLETDGAAKRHMAAGRPEHDLITRCEMVSHLRDAAVVTSLTPERFPRFFEELQPYTVVSCSSQPPDALAALAEASADARERFPPLSGCFTEEIHTAIYSGRTPVEWTPSEHYPAPSRDRRSALPVTGGTSVTVNGCFDVLHLGHLRFLADARRHGTALTVLMNDDDSIRRYKGPTRPVFPLAFRMAALQALRWVDAVVPFSEDTPLRMLCELRPTIHVKGGSYEEDRVRAERECLAAWGGQLAFLPMVEGFSTSAYIRRVLERFV